MTTVYLVNVYMSCALPTMACLVLAAGRWTLKMFGRPRQCQWWVRVCRVRVRACARVCACVRAFVCHEAMEGVAVTPDSMK